MKRLAGILGGAAAVLTPASAAFAASNQDLLRAIDAASFGTYAVPYIVVFLAAIVLAMSMIRRSQN